MGEFVTKVLFPALIGTLLICGYFLPAGLAIYWRRWLSAIFLAVLLGFGLIMLPFLPLATGLAWIVAVLFGWLSARDAKRDHQHRELLASLERSRKG